MFVLTLSGSKLIALINILSDKTCKKKRNPTSVLMGLGAKVTTIPGFRMPVSTRPTGTVPIPETMCNVILPYGTP